MPAVSKTQQRLMGMAYSIKKGETSLSDIDKEYREEVKGLVDGMTLKQLKDFAATKHTGLPERVPENNIALGDISGMGPIKLPQPTAGGTLSNPTDVGSGDVPNGRKKDKDEEEEEEKERIKKNKNVLGFDEFFESKKKYINQEIIQ